jgi:hypothetical protein
LAIITFGRKKNFPALITGLLAKKSNAYKLATRGNGLVHTIAHLAPAVQKSSAHFKNICGM